MKQVYYDQRTMEAVIVEEPPEELVSKNLHSDGVYLPGFFSVLVQYGGTMGYLDDCLDSVIFPEGIKGEIIVGCTDNFPKREVTTISLPEWHYSRNNNVLARKARGDILIFLNDDCRVICPDWLQKFARDFEDPDVGMVGCKLLYPDDTVQHGGMTYGITNNKVHVEHRYRHKERFYPPACAIEPVYGVTAACVAVRHQLFDWVGGFDERYRYECQDTDLCIKILSVGKKIIYDGSIEVYHHEAATKKVNDIPMMFGPDRDLLFRRTGFYIMQNRLTGNPAPQMPGLKEAARILLIRKGAAGDVLMATPVVSALRKAYPRAFIAFRTDVPEILKGNPCLDAINEPTSHMYDMAVSLSYEDSPMENAFMVYARQAGIRLDGEGMAIYPDKEDRQWAKKKMQGNMNYIAIHTGRSWPNREWDMDKFMHVCTWLKNKGYGIVECGNQETVYLGEGIDARDAETYQRTAALIERCCAFIGIDSVCAHIAKAEGCPAFVLYGCASPESRRCPGAEEYPIWNYKLECRGCRNRTGDIYIECHKGDNACMKSISPETVLNLFCQWERHKNGES